MLFVGFIAFSYFIVSPAIASAISEVNNRLDKVEMRIEFQYNELRKDNTEIKEILKRVEERQYLEKSK